MFEIGFSEIMVIFGLALVVLGPEKLPGLAANIGRWVGRARAMARQFREQLETEAESLKSSVAAAESSIKSGVSDIQSAVTDVDRQFAEADRQLDMPLEPPAVTPAAEDVPTPGSPAANHTDLGQHERGT